MSNEKGTDPNRVVTIPATGSVTFTEKDGDIVWDSEAKVYRILPRLRTDLRHGQEVVLRFNKAEK